MPSKKRKRKEGVNIGTRSKQSIKILTPMPTGMAGICGTAGKLLG